MYLPINLGTTVGIAYCIVVMLLMMLFLAKPEYPKSKEIEEKEDWN